MSVGLQSPAVDFTQLLSAAVENAGVKTLTRVVSVRDHRWMRVLLVVALLASACGSKPNPGVCCISLEDCQSIGAADPQNPRLCADGLSCIDHECVTAPDGSVGCGSDGDCTNPATPHCAPDKVCVGCIDSTQCSGTTPRCDTTSRSCRACAVDDDCASEVCDQPTGMCIDSADIVYASPGGSASAACTMSDPCSLSHAFDVAASPRATIKMLAGDYTAGGLAVAGRNLTLDGFGATMTTATGTAFEISGSTRFKIVGLHLVTSDSGNVFGINCQGTDGITTSLILDQFEQDASSFPVFGACTVSMTRSTIRNHTSTKQFVLGGVTTIDRCLFDGGDGLVAFGNTSVTHITNSVIENQLGPDSAYAGGSFLGSTCGSMFVSFSTVLNSTVKCAAGKPICLGGTACGSCTDNSIVFNTANTAPADITGSGCEVDYSLVLPQSTALVGANNKLGLDPLMVDPAQGDVHLRPGSPAVDAADPAVVGTPDFDGITRPQGPRSDMGAFELKP